MAQKKNKKKSGCGHISPAEIVEQARLRKYFGYYFANLSTHAAFDAMHGVVLDKSILDHSEQDVRDEIAIRVYRKSAGSALKMQEELVGLDRYIENIENHIVFVKQEDRDRYCEYNKYVRLPDGNHDGYYYVNATFRRGMILCNTSVYKNLVTADAIDTLFYPYLMVLDCDTPTSAIMDDTGTWMSTSIEEYMTQEAGVQAATGKVLTFGLGLGYYAFACAAKPDVKSVTVVERSQEVIDLYEKYIYDNIPNKEKIHIVHADAFDFMANMEDGEFDYCYADIWRGSLDGVPLYARFKNLERRFHKTRFGYWIEESILMMIREGLLVTYLRKGHSNMLMEYQDRIESTPFGQFCFEYWAAKKVHTCNDFKKALSISDIRRTLLTFQPSDPDLYGVMLDAAYADMVCECPEFNANNIRQIVQPSKKEEI